MSFVTVKFANNENLLFNPNCKTVVLLDDIKKRCKCNENAILEVSNTKGEIKHLQEHLHENATSVLKGREMLILLEVQSNEETKELKYVPLLKNMKKLYPDALDRLIKLTNKHADDKDCVEVGLRSSSRQKVRKISQSANNSSNSKNSSSDNNNNLQVNKGTRKLSVEQKRKERQGKSRS